MAVQLDGGGKEDLKTQFVTREGTYKLMTLSEYSRPNRVGYTNSQGSASVRVSFVTLPDPADPTGAQGLGDRMCFNFGKELYVYVYRGVKKVRPDDGVVAAMARRDAFPRGTFLERTSSSRPNLSTLSRMCRVRGDGDSHLCGWSTTPRTRRGCRATSMILAGPISRAIRRYRSCFSRRAKALTW